MGIFSDTRGSNFIPSSTDLVKMDIYVRFSMFIIVL
jgi:hypothetical protein